MTGKLRRNVVLPGTLADLERAYDKIHAWFFAYPQGEFSLNNLCAELDISKTTANVVVSGLEKEGFLEKKILGKLWRIKANQGHVFFTTRKIAFNLRLIYESGIIEWVKKELPNARAIVLFGSYRKGEDIETSDIDIAVEVLDDKPIEVVKIVVLEKFGYRKKVPVNIHLFSRNKIDLNVFASIANGIVLQGFLEVHP